MSQQAICEKCRKPFGQLAEWQKACPACAAQGPRYKMPSLAELRARLLELVPSDAYTPAQEIVVMTRWPERVVWAAIALLVTCGEIDVKDSRQGRPALLRRTQHEVGT